MKIDNLPAMPRVPPAWATLAFLIAFLFAACSPKPESKSLTTMPAPVVLAVQQAKKDGQRTASVSSTVDSSRNSNLSEELAAGSVMVVTPKRLNALVTAGDSFVSWSVFSVEREIGQQSIHPSACFEQPPPSLLVGSHEVAVGLLGGSMEVDGVMVTWESGDSSLNLQDGDRYLLLGIKCSDRQVQTRNPGYSFASLTSSGELRPLPNQSERVYPQFFKELMELRTLDAVAERVRKEGKN